MKIRDVMTTNVVTVAPETALKEVIECLVRSEVSGLPVLDENGRLVGIATEADVIPKEAYATRRRRALSLLGDLLSGRDHPWVQKAAGASAADVMTKNVIVCSTDDDIRVAARRMAEHGIKRMPVVEGGVLVGIVSRHDILAAFDRPDDRIAADVERALARDPNRPDDFHVDVSVGRGIVTLRGDVRCEWDAPVVVSIVRGVPGVINVVSVLHAREPRARASGEGWMLGPR
jgi:CBS domain-containing protein